MQVATAVAALREKGLNVLTPATFTTSPPVGHQLALKIVHATEKDFYKTPNGFAPHGRFLMDLGRACGAVWRVDLQRRTDNGNEPYLVEFEAVCIVPDPTTGRPTAHKGTARMDYRDGSAAVETMTKRAEAKAKNSKWEVDIMKDVRQKRQFIVELCETRAMLRALRR